MDDAVGTSGSRAPRKGHPRVNLVDAKAARARGDDRRAVFARECRGTFSDAPGSQTYVQPFAALYPSVGDFIGVVGKFEGRTGSPTRRRFGTMPSTKQATSSPCAATTCVRRGWSKAWSTWCGRRWRAVGVAGTIPAVPHTSSSYCLRTAPSRSLPTGALNHRAPRHRRPSAGVEGEARCTRQHRGGRRPRHQEGEVVVKASWPKR